MKFEDALQSARGGQKIYRATDNALAPFTFGNMPSLGAADLAAVDWEIYSAPLTDEEIAEAFEARAAAFEAEADERERARRESWEKALAEHKAAGGSDENAPQEPRASRSSIAITLRSCAEVVRTRKLSPAKN